MGCGVSTFAGTFGSDIALCVCEGESVAAKRKSYNSVDGVRVFEGLRGFITSRSTTVPGLNRRARFSGVCKYMAKWVVDGECACCGGAGMSTLTEGGADLRAAFVANLFRGALPPVLLRAVCFVLAMANSLSWNAFGMLVGTVVVVVVL